MTSLTGVNVIQVSFKIFSFSLQLLTFYSITKVRKWYSSCVIWANSCSYPVQKPGNEP